MTPPTRSFAGVLKRQGFAHLLAAQALAVFDDNTFKQILLLFITAKVAAESERHWMIPSGAALFILPYILFSSYAGQVADRFSKRRVIIGLKVAEVGLLSLATLAMAARQIPMMLAVLFLLGVQSTLLAPAKEGILPQIFLDENLSRANGLMQLTVYTMIVLGPVAAGFLLSFFPSQPQWAVACLIPMAILGLGVALGITRVSPLSAGELFRWNAAAEFRRHFSEIRRDRALLQTVLGIAYFWMMGAIYLLNVLGYGHDLLGLDERGISYLTAAVSIGIGLGAVVAAKLSGDQVELGLVPLGSIGLGVFAIALYFSSHSFELALAGHFLLGFSGGVFIVPLEAFLQARASEQSKGRIIAASNVITFTGVFLASGLLWALTEPLRLAPNQVILVVGVLSFGATAYIMTVLPDFTVRLCLWLLAHTFYRIRTEGLENLPRRGAALLVSNHISFIDPFLIGACTQRFIRFLMYRQFYETRGIRWLAKLMGAIPVSEDDSPRKIVESLREAQEKLRQGEWVSIFAEGSISRTGNLLRFRRGFERITRGLDVPIIPVHLDRVWGSIFSYERGRFFFKWPRRIPYPVTVSVGPPLPADADAFRVRQAVMELSAQAFAHRDAAQQPLPELFLDTARRNWRRFAMADSSRRELNFGQVLVGAMLFRRLVLKHCRNEKTVGVLLPPSAPAALLNLGISLSAKVPVNLNYTAPAEAMEVAIARSGIQTIFTSPKLLERISMAPRSGMVMMEDASLEFTRGDKILSALAARLAPQFILRRWLLAPDMKLDSLATVIFSSGSTGIPKGVMLSHRNIVSNLEGVQQALHVDRNDCLLGVLPFFHSFGYTIALWLPVVSGFGVVYHSNPLESRKVGELCRQYGVTLLIATPTFAWDYVRRCPPESFASLRVAIVGAEKMKPELAAAFKEKFGKELCEGYGATELSPVVSVGTPGFVGPAGAQVGNKPGSVGHPIPGLAARVVDPASFEDLGPDKEGMLLVKGASVMMGYLGEPEKTRQAIREGWYITGDVARLDQDGFITITDRLTRFSKIAGEMVPHLQVEDALHQALGTAEPKLVVTSLPDAQKGERLVVLHTPLEISLDELLTRLRNANLPRLWLPRKENFFQIDSLPVLGSGKLDLKQVKDTAKKLGATQSATAGGESSA